MKDVKTGPNRWDIEYTSEERANIDRHRRNLRLNLACEEMFRAIGHYGSLRAALGEEQRREEEVIN